jgi:CBS domain-containing protein
MRKSRMPTAFNFQASPFDRLNDDERRLVRDSLDIAYFREGATLLDPGREATHLFVVVKGHVRELDGDEVVASYGPDDSFDGRSLVAGRASNRFVAAEEVLAYELARDAVRDLIARNATFGALLFSDLSRKLGALAERHGQRETQALAMARVGEAYLREAHVVDGDTDIVAVARLFRDRRTSCVLVRLDEARLGIFTTTGLQRAVLDGRPLATLAVRELATFPLVRVSPRAPLYDALALMIRHQVHRLVVAEGERIDGLLEQLDALSFVSNHSYLITLQIVQAADLDALAEAARRITRLIALLYRGGTRVAQIATLVQQLNAKLFERAWQLVAPQSLQAASCLFVMGSEGRGEQLLRTDQDNGLVVADDFDALDEEAIGAACARFSAALERFGYPPCPGGVMVSNPAWRMRSRDFAEQARRWLLTPDGEGLMRLAIFLDAHAVAGDAALLARLRGTLDGLVAADDALLGRFAQAIDAFGEEGTASGWWGRLLAGAGQGTLDLKKAGIFAIVHGVRGLALEQRIAATGTAARLDALVAAGRLPADLATDLADSLHFLMALRLDAGLAEIDAGRAVSGLVDAARLSALDRDLLKDALAVVKRFKALLRHHFRLAA